VHHPRADRRQRERADPGVTEQIEALRRVRPFELLAAVSLVLVAGAPVVAGAAMRAGVE